MSTTVKMPSMPSMPSVPSTMSMDSSASSFPSQSGGRRRRRGRSSKRGGGGATDFVGNAVGSLATQMQNAAMGNQLQPVDGSLNSVATANLKGGRRRKRRSCKGGAPTRMGGARMGGKRTKRGKKGGSWLSTAAVPLGLWAAQNRLTKRRSSSSKSSRRNR